MYRFRVLSTIAALVLAGCSFSSIDPDAEVVVTGRALDASGAPLRGATVLLVKQADIGEVVFGSILAVGTLSTVCFLPDPPALCASARRATTDDDGRYRFELEGSETQGTLGTASTLSVTFAAGPDEASTSVTFTVKKAAVSLPDARLWDAGATSRLTASGIRVAWKPLAPEAAPRPAYSVQAYERDSEFALWSQTASGSPATIDPRILENGAGTVTASAEAKLPGASGAGGVTGHYLSNRVAQAVPPRAPASRGRRCAAVTGTAPARSASIGPCTATDGNLTDPARPSVPDGDVVTGVVVDLGRVRGIDLVVARGFAGQVVLELSSDGRAFRTVATSSGTVALPVPGDQRGRYVRLRSPAGLDESLSSEISVW